MDPIENQPTSPSIFEAVEKNQPDQSSGRPRQLFLLGAVLVLSLSVNLFLLSQVIWLGKDLNRNQQFISEYETKDGPIVGRFFNQLVEFARGHSDFVPILAKYRLVTVTPAPSSPPSQTNPSK